MKHRPFNATEEALSEAAINWVKRNKRTINTQFAGSIPKTEKPISVFMAGSSGAGKTELSERFIRELEKDFPVSIARIDPDDIRALLPGYVGHNSEIFQSAIAIAAEKILDFCFDHKKSFLLDGTLASQTVSLRNIERSIRHGRRVLILYVFQDPIRAWDFVKAREAKTGRSVPKESFVEGLFQSRENVNFFKEKFGEQVKLWVFLKDYDSSLAEFHPDQMNVDAVFRVPYSKEELLKIL